MTRGKQKIESQRKNAEKNQKQKGSQIEARALGLKVVCPICKEIFSGSTTSGYACMSLKLCLGLTKKYREEVQLANEKQMNDHYGSKHPKETPPNMSG